MRRWLLALLVLVPIFAVAQEEKKETETAPVTEWLLLGPVDAALPAFHDEKPGAYSLEDYLNGRQIREPGLRPEGGARIDWSPGASLEWKKARTGDAGTVALGNGSEPGVAWLATYLRAGRFVSVKLKVRGDHYLQIDLDDETQATRAKSIKPEEGEEPEEGSDELTASLELEPGVHRILVKTLRDPECERPWSVAAEMEAAPEAVAAIRMSIRPAHPLELAQIVDAPRPTEVAVSPDGELAAITLQRILPGTHDRESWVEVRWTGTGEIFQSFRGLEMGPIAWAPTGRRFSYVTRGSGDQKEQSTLWLADLDAGVTRPILERVERLGQYTWSPDGRSVVYEISDKPPEDKTGIQRLEGIRDRRTGFRTRSYLHQVLVPGGSRRRLTSGRLSTAPGSVSPDGTRLLFLRTPDTYDTRPYTGNELYLLDLDTLEVELVHDGPFINDATWSPDGAALALLGGPGAFDGAGKTTPPDVIANDYDIQLYLLDLDTGDVAAVSREFDPSISDIAWSAADGRIHLRVEEEDREVLYRFDPETGEFDPVRTPVGVVDQFDLSRNGAALILRGSSVDRPQAVWLGPPDGKPRLFLDPAVDEFRHVRFGKVEPFNFLNSRGERIVGRVHYPPDFDQSRRYPAIIYYYGGTLPVSRSFGGRYPLSWWAAHGYVVYVSQPGGTRGFGQEFSALHVNAWGDYADDDIMAGVDAFLEAHPFVDPERLGCIGASYGGFMTQYLLTRTDRFGACVSHAGISDLTSYWGEGYWGYSYNAVAAAESFPWNNRDLYVEHSPLFHADRIRTPLLLTHGASDTNVPPGESEQMYTALKLLGRDVEYVRFEGQNHFILKHDQRLVWSKSIVAWFDRWLKDEPEWWNHLYPEPGAEKKDGK